jgi:hypothetical protein
LTIPNIYVKRKYVFQIDYTSKKQKGEIEFLERKGFKNGTHPTGKPALPK